jgi:hypothetical protein
MPVEVSVHSNCPIIVVGVCLLQPTIFGSSSTWRIVTRPLGSSHKKKYPAVTLVSLITSYNLVRKDLTSEAETGTELFIFILVILKHILHEELC